jgi:hypothetical protein
MVRLSSVIVFVATLFVLGFAAPVANNEGVDKVLRGLLQITDLMTALDELVLNFHYDGLNNVVYVSILAFLQVISVCYASSCCFINISGYSKETFYIPSTFRYDL